MHGFCYNCNQDRELVCKITCCDYMPNGLVSEIKNHPRFKGGLIQCSDFAEDMPDGVKPCHPIESVWDQNTPLENYSDPLYRCSVCDTLTWWNVKDNQKQQANQKNPSGEGSLK